MNNTQSLLGFKQKTIAVMVGMALPALIQLSVAEASCTAGAASVDANSVVCTEGSTYNNSVTIQNTATISTAGTTTSVVQMDGNSNRFTNAGSLSNTSIYNNTASNMGQKYGVYIGANAGSATTDETNKLKNSGTISAEISSANMSSNASRVNTGAVVGLGTDAEGEYTLTNSGTISATHYGVGRVNGVEAGGDVESMTITNSGTILGTSASNITLTRSTAASFQGTTGLYATAANIGVATGIYAEEEAQSLTILNRASGIISGVGSYASGIYTRAVETVIVNDGTISGSKIGVAQVSDSNEIRSMTLTNSGEINGDILSVNGSALRWWSLSNGEGTNGATLDSRLTINSQAGQADSKITNSGEINGNIYYSNGSHTLINTEGGVLNGNIDLDQRDTINGAVTNVGTKEFSFENAGSFTGNLTLRTAATNVTSNIILLPTITGVGGNTPDTALATGIAGMGNTLNIITMPGADESTVVIKPKIAGNASVANNQYYQLASTYQINSVNVASGASTLPNVEASNSLISWNTSVNSNHALVLASIVNDASAVSGVSGNSATALNALASANNPLFSTIANMDSDQQVAEAAQSLVPEVNGASVSAALKAAGSSNQIISNRSSMAQTSYIARLGNERGVSTGEEPYSTGFWFQGIGFNADQQKRKGADGYDVAAFGFALGVDRVINNDNNLRVGGAVTYTHSGIDAKGNNQGDSVNVGSYLGSVYASANMGDWYLNGVITAGQHRYDSKRRVVGNQVTADYDAIQYGINLDAGLPIKTGIGTFVPVAIAAYNYLDIDGYSEKGTGGLKISGDNIYSLRSGLGARMLFPVYKNNSYVELRGIWYHEFGDNRFDTTGRFVSGGSSFKTAGVTQARDTANLGASLRIMGDTTSWLQQSVLLSYDAEVKDQYLSHTGSLQVRFDF